ncbi:MAG TPA: hypothetical protein VL461_14535 [Dictyobacter sp.]|nr:hypothetical protein [Dictyobacter sp.]
MQQFQRSAITRQLVPKTPGPGTIIEQIKDHPGLDETNTEASRRSPARQGIMHVRIEHFYCTLEEQLDPSLRGQSYVIGTGTGRPNEPGRIIDVSPAAQRLGLVPGMPLRRAHRIAPRTRFLPASYDAYQPILQKLKDRYRTYSRIIESIAVSDAFIDLHGSELTFTSPVEIAEQLCDEISEMGQTALTGIASGKTIAELAALMSRRDGRHGVLYIPPGREASFVQTLPLTFLLRLRSIGANQPQITAELKEQNDSQGQPQYTEVEWKGEQFDPVAISELVAHLRDFGITTFAQVAALTEEGLVRRLGRPGGWLYQIANGNDQSLVVPDAPPVSQNARVHFHHHADADETCNAIRKLADYLGSRLQEQHLKGQSIALILWPIRTRKDTRKLVMSAEGEAIGESAPEETIGGQMQISRHSDEADIIAHHSLMLFAHYHRSGMHYVQVQLRIGDMISTAPTFYTPPTPPYGRLTRKL